MNDVWGERKKSIHLTGSPAKAAGRRRAVAPAVCPNLRRFDAGTGFQLAFCWCPVVLLVNDNRGQGKAGIRVYTKNSRTIRDSQKNIGQICSKIGRIGFSELQKREKHKDRQRIRVLHGLEVERSEIKTGYMAIYKILCQNGTRSPACVRIRLCQNGRR